MARIHRVQKSNKVHQCSKGHEIPKGEPYTWAKPGFRRRTPLIRCIQHPFRPSELMTGAASAPTAAVEAFDDACLQGFEDMDALEAAWDELRDAVQEYADERQQALDAWEHGNSQLEEYLETANAALQEIEGHTFESFDEGEPELVNFDDDQAEYEAAFQEWEDARDAHVEEQVDEAQSVAGSLEF